MLYDAAFLKQLDEQHDHTYYVRIQALTFDEQFLDKLEGRVTSGSINLDGKSAIRRSCSLSFVAEINQVNDYYWTFKQKFTVEIGLDNTINKDYPDRIWFNMGTFFITSFSSTLAANSISVNIQGKDKMCLLNGELGGVINAETDFGTYDYTDANGNLQNIKLEIKDIITDLIYTYAQEPLANIVIQDLDEYGLEQLDYKGDEPLYLIRPANDTNYILPIFESMNPTIYLNNQPIAFNDAELVYDSLMGSLFEEISTATRFRFENNNLAPEFCAAKVTYGEAIGYRTCPLVYAGQLIAKAGDTITSVLDKIVKMLGDFEYFYDVDGRFVFRRKKSFINTLWTPKVTTIDGDTYYSDYYYASPYTYEFEGTKLITNIQNSPQLASIKNDYTVWGERSSTNGGKIPIHSRYAIDSKPIYYVSVVPNAQPRKVWTVLTKSELQDEYPQFIDEITYHINDSLDWRELIYQMAIEYRRYNHSEFNLQDFTTQLAQVNYPLYPFGHTGYEQYYTDLEGFWRQLYYPFKEEDIDLDSRLSQYNKLNIEEAKLSNEELYVRGVYIPNVKPLQKYGLAAHNELSLKPNELLVQIPNSDDYVLIDVNKYYYEDALHRGFDIPTITNRKILMTYNPNGSNEVFLSKLVNGGYKNIYTAAVDITSQLWYKYDEIQRTFLPWMDQYDYVPSLPIIDLIPEYTIENFFERKFSSDDTFYNIIDESYTGSKYQTYILSDKDQLLASYLSLQNSWLQIISRILDKNINTYEHWSSYFSFTSGESFLDLLNEACLETLANDFNSESSVLKTFINNFERYCDFDTYFQQCESADWVDYLLTIDDIDDLNESFKSSIYIEGSNLNQIFQSINSIEQLIKALRAYEKLFSNEDSFMALKYQRPLSYKLFVELLPQKHWVAPGNIREGDSLMRRNCMEVFVYDNENYYKLSDIQSHPALAQIYNNTLSDSLVLIKYDIHGNPNPLSTYNQLINYYHRELNYYNNNNEKEKAWWNKQVFTEPYNLNFWFDFLDTQGEISKYSVSEIGDRPIVINDTNLKSIFYREIPKIIIMTIDNFSLEKIKTGYNYILLPIGYENFFSISARGLSIHNKLNELVYQHTYCNQTVNLTCIPIYYLDVNSRVHFSDITSKFCDDLAIQTISYSLNYNGTMSISAVKIQPNSIVEREE